MPKLKPGTIFPSPEEDAAINAGIAADPDAAELSDEWFRKAGLARKERLGLISKDEKEELENYRRRLRT